MTETIKNCPFCGGEAELPDGRGTQYEICCPDCGQSCVSVQICDLMTIEERMAEPLLTEENDYRHQSKYVERAKCDAIKAWNNRPREQELEAKVKELEEKLEVRKKLAKGMRAYQMHTVIGFLEKENTALRKELADREWQDISLAPINKKVLIKREYKTKDNLYEVGILSKAEDEVDVQAMWCNAEDCDFIRFEPTHYKLIGENK